MVVSVVQYRSPAQHFPGLSRGGPDEFITLGIPLLGLHDGQVFFSPAGKLAQRCVQVAGLQRFQRQAVVVRHIQPPGIALQGLRPCALRKLYGYLPGSCHGRHVPHIRYRLQSLLICAAPEQCCSKNRRQK